ncbi:MAG: hypothetical protein WC620_04565 [Methanoregula sp.]
MAKMVVDCYPMNHPEIKKRLDVVKKAGFKRTFALSRLYLAAVFINGFLILVIANAIRPLDLTSTFPTALAVIVYFVVISLDFILLYHNKITPAIITLVVIFAWILLPYQFISGQTILDKKKTPIEIRKSIFHKKYPIIG